MKKVLILGGTQFIGRNLVEELEKLKNYDLTLFNRQQTAPELFQNLKKIRGDRETTAIEQLYNQNWDIVIDISCYYPDGLADLISKMKGKIGRYIFISTISVYAWEKKLEVNITENFEISNCTISERKNTSSETYGKRKAACENILLDARWLDKIILRPSIIYGKYDKTNRLYYWINKVNQGKPFLIPEDIDEKITLTYINDLVNIIIMSMEIKNHNTIYNASTHQPITLKNIIDLISKSISKSSNYIEVPAQELLRNDIQPEVDLPLWFNEHLSINNEKLTTDFDIQLTPFEQSIQETIAYYKNLNYPKTDIGLNLDKEQVLINQITTL